MSPLFQGPSPRGSLSSPSSASCFFSLTLFSALMLYMSVPLLVVSSPHNMARGLPFRVGTRKTPLGATKGFISSFAFSLIHSPFFVSDLFVSWENQSFFFSAPGLLQSPCPSLFRLPILFSLDWCPLRRTLPPDRLSRVISDLVSSPEGLHTPRISV